MLFYTFIHNVCSMKGIRQLFVSRRSVVNLPVEGLLLFMEPAEGFQSLGV